MRLSLQQKEQFFHEMSELLRSGRSVPEALDHISQARTPAVRAVARTMRAAGGDGSAGSFFAAAPDVFSDLDREVVAGGETSGRLDDAMQYLSAYYDSLARARRRVIAGTLYPFFMLHFAAVMLAVPALMTGGMEAFAAQAVIFVGVFYGLFLMGWLVFRTAVRAAGTNVAADRLLQSIPGLGGARVALVGSRFCMLMGMLVKASSGIFSAMSRSASASGSALFCRGSEEAVAAVQGGAALGPAVARTRAFPESINRAFEVGEISGRLDEEMSRQAGRYTEQLNTRLNLIAGALGKVILLGVVLAIGYRIILFYLGYFQTVNSLLE